MTWKTKSRIGRAFCATIVGLILLYLMLPSLIVISTAFGPQENLSFPPQGFTLRWIIKAFTYPDFRKGMWNSFILVLTVPWITILVGTGFVYAAERYPFRGSSVLLTVLLSPLLVPHFIIGLAGLILATGLGWQRTYTAIIVTHVIVVVPFVIRSVSVSLRTIDPAIVRAAIGLGATPARLFWNIDIPLIAPGLFAGFLFSAILSFTEFSATLLVTGQQTQTLPVAMFTYTRDWPDPTLAAISTIFIATSFCLLIVATRWLGLARILSVQHER